MASEMSCSRCSRPLRHESIPHVICTCCGERYHDTCLNDVEMSGYCKSKDEFYSWHSCDRSDDSDSIREELEAVWSQQPASASERPQWEATMEAVATEVLKTEDEGEADLAVKPRESRQKYEEEEDADMSIVQEGAEEDDQNETNNTEEDQALEVGDIDVLHMEPGTEEDLAAMLDFL